MLTLSSANSQMSFLSQLSNASSSVTGAAQSSNSADDKEEVGKDSSADAKSSCVMSIHVSCINCSSSKFAEQDGVIPVISVNATLTEIAPA